MKAIAVYPGQAHSVHLEDVPMPSVDQIPHGKGVLVRVLKVGVDATDREINEALYGKPPPGQKYLVLGHEVFGIVEAVGRGVRRVKPGDHVTATVRRPGGSIYDQIGTSDMTSEETYYERGINLLHGFLTEFFVEDEDFVIRVPPGLKHLHVLMEPISCAAKAVEQAFEVQRRMKVWQPQRAFVMGAGQIGLLATLILRLRGLNVFTMARSEAPNLRSEIVAGMEARYVSLRNKSLADVAAESGKADLIIDATGSSHVAIESMQHLGMNGVLVWTSITGGETSATIDAARINLEWVLGNKLLLGSVNSNRGHFESGIRDLALGEVMFPGVVQRILTHPIDGLDGYQDMMRLLESSSALKVFVNVAQE